MSAAQLQKQEDVPAALSRRAPANDPVHGARPIQVTTSRFVTITLAAALTGLTEKAIRRKMERNVWLEGKHWRRADGGIYIDMKEYEQWVVTAAA